MPWIARLRLLVLVFWVLLPGGMAAAHAASAGALDVAPMPLPVLSLTHHVATLEDPGGRLTLQDVLRPELAARFASGHPAAEAFNHGITPSAWWFRITLRNPLPQAQQRLLEVGYARLSQVSLHQLLPDGSVHTVDTGVTAPFASRPLAHRFFVFPITLAPGSEQTLYLRVQSLTAFIVPLRLWEPQAFHHQARNDYLAQAWYLGMATAMVLFNLLLFVRLGDRIYIHYVAFALCMAFAVAAQNGLVKEFLPLQAPWWSDLASTFGYSLAIATGLQFMRHMLGTAHTQPLWDRVLRPLVAFFVLSPVVFVWTGQTFIPSAAVVYLGAVLVAVATALRGVWQRQRSAYFFMAAFGLLALGAMANAVRAMGLLPTNGLTANAMQIGSALEMVLLAFALADRFNEMRREKAGIQKKLLTTQQTLIDNLRQSEQVLEQRVQERTQELQQLNQKLAALSMTDGLTGIANRRHFDEILATEWHRAQRSGQPLTLALLDVDWFKSYNDHYGHLAGDECLRSIAHVLAQSAVRSGDLVARYGGEEFAFLAPDTDAAGVVEVAHRIQATLAQLALPHGPSAYQHVTVSIGLASVVPSLHDTPDTLVRLADQALYRAKTEGRNRIVLA